MRDSFIARLEALAATDRRVFLITGDLGFKVLDRFSDRFPAQFLNAGVAEQNMTAVATGIALEGRVVFTYSIANFPTLRCLEHIRNDAAYHNANVKIVAVGGGFSYGALGMSHHATEDLAIMRALPGVTVVVPGCLWEAEEATEALLHTPGVAYLRLDKSDAGRTNRDNERFELGRMRQLRDGAHLTFIVSGGILGVALRAADQLANEGLGVRVLSAHTLRPFDVESVLHACRETGGVMTIEEHVVEGGLGGVVAETCLEAGMTPRVFHRIGIREGFVTAVGSQEYLRQCHGMDVSSIVANAKRLIRSVGARPDH